MGSLVYEPKRLLRERLCTDSCFSAIVCPPPRLAVGKDLGRDVLFPFQNS